MDPFEGDGNQIRGPRTRAEGNEARWKDDLKANTHTDRPQYYVDDEYDDGYTHAEQHRHSTTRPGEKRANPKHYMENDMDGNPNVSV